MAGRGRLARHPDQVPSPFSQVPPPVMPRARGPLSIRALEEEFLLQREEIQRLVANNRRLFEENVTLKREAGAVKEEIHNLSEMVPRLRADKEAQARDLIQKGLKLEADIRSADPLKTEVLHLRNEAKKLDMLRQEMLAKVQGLSQDLKRLQAENEQLPSLYVNLDGLRQELERARSAYEYEKKANADSIQQREAMEKSLVAMARELEKLRVEHETRARVPAGAYNPDPNMGYPRSYSDVYGVDNGRYTGSWGPYDARGFTRR